MNRPAIECRFARSVPFIEAEGTLHLARIAASTLVGEERVRIEAPYRVDPSSRTIIVDVHHKAGRLAGLIFAGLARREFGRDAVTIEHVADRSTMRPQDCDV